MKKIIYIISAIFLTLTVYYSIGAYAAVDVFTNGGADISEKAPWLPFTPYAWLLFLFPIALIYLAKNLYEWKKPVVHKKQGYAMLAVMIFAVVLLVIESHLILKATIGEFWACHLDWARYQGYGWTGYMWSIVTGKHFPPALIVGLIELGLIISLVRHFKKQEVIL